MENDDAAALLAEARKAWADMILAKGQMNRLGQYKRMNPGMREDYMRAGEKLAKSESTLHRILGIGNSIQSDDR